jgi:hypothetical protein
MRISNKFPIVMVLPGLWPTICPRSEVVPHKAQGRLAGSGCSWWTCFVFCCHSYVTLICVFTKKSCLGGG